MSHFRSTSWCSLCIACILGVLLTACNATQDASRDEAQNPPARIAVGEADNVPPAASPAPSVASPASEVATVPPDSTGAPAVPDTPASSAAKPERPASNEAVKPPPSAAPASKAPAPSVASAAPASKPLVPSAAKPPAAPPLDLKALETRLKETNAIGVYTKLTLKNQVDDLLDAFRAYYKGQAKSTLAELRRAFDQLVLKVIALLQDADPPLASAIVASREAIWGILSDPVKFATV